MTVFELFESLREGVKLPMSYTFDLEKRIHILYLFSSFLLAFYVYKNSKQKLSFLAYVFNKKIWLSPSAYVDYFLFFFNGLIKVLLILPYLSFALLLASSFQDSLYLAFGPQYQFIEPTVLVLMYWFASVLLQDFGTYLVHLAFHKLPWLWEFHKIHHSAESLNPISQYRIHPIELIVNNLKSSLILGFNLGLFNYLANGSMSELEFLSVNIFSFLFLFWGANLRHSHVALKYFHKLEHWLISPFQHQIHHSNNTKHFDKNLGAKLAIWDRLFGTLIRSKDIRSKLKFGLQEQEQIHYRSFFQNLMMPFVQLLRRFGALFKKL
ncbi:MAG: sterol desaturase family protein [Flavobacteriales bacterium]